MLVHIEIELPDRTTTLKLRLPGYYHHLRTRYGLKVLPLVLYLKVGLDGIGQDEVNDALFGFLLNTFRYLYVGLPGLNAEDYVTGDNWLGVALSALMRIPRERVMELGAEAMARISGAVGLTAQQRHLLGECVEAYIDVPEANLKQFHDMIAAKATGRVTPVNKTSYDRGIEKGRQEGQQAGLLLGLQAAVRELLEAKFGTLPEELLARIAASADSAELRKWLLEAGTANTLAEFRIAAGL